MPRHYSAARGTHHDGEMCRVLASGAMDSGSAAY